MTKTYRPDNGLLVRFNDVWFSFFKSYTSNVHLDGAGLPFLWEKSSKMCLKINRSVKTPCYSPSTGVARSRLWAPALILFRGLGEGGGGGGRDSARGDFKANGTKLGEFF